MPEIVEYATHHQPWFEKFNRDWIEKYFWMEPIDVEVLQHPEEHIIKKGGKIFMASVDRQIAGTVALKYVSPGVYEFTKMAVEERFRGKQVGKALAEAAIVKAKELRAHKIILYSNTILTPAIELYRKLGFREVPVDGPYKRSNIKMELVTDGTPDPVTIRTATQEDVPTLVELGIRTFRESFEEMNTPENMKLYLDSTFTTEKLSAEFREPNAVFFLACEKEIPVGFAKVRASKTPEGLNSTRAIEIERIYVVREQIGKGAGQKLMQTCLDLARQKRYEFVWLGVWEHNARALRFYKKWGFEHFSQHVFMLGLDAQTDLLMKKKL
ncbi:MAG TPA: GNAT family N-acetyltransferase [Chryseosolibacter sp.]|nr:GNAT family N-acetyltransferase [Chryseosolibacter sp.]